LSGAYHVHDEKAIEAMKIAFTGFKLVLEPSGALGIAALLNGALDGHIKAGDCVGVVACGGNVSLEDYMRFLR
jgi:threonine dehydratase